jgi:hypothetical protein
LKNPNTIRTFVAHFAQKALCNVLAEAATLNDPATDDSGVRVSKHVRRAALRPILLKNSPAVTSVGRSVI